MNQKQTSSKGEKQTSSKKGESSKGGETPSESSQHKKEEQQIEEETKGESRIQGEAKPTLDGGKHIQASVSSSIYQFLQIYACFNCVVINHQKGGDCNEHGPIQAISSDFGDRMTTQ